MRITPADWVVAKRLRLKKRGIVYPATTVAEARRAGLELAVALALLMQESSGGHNVFGHDPVDNIRGGVVTEARYRSYLHKRTHTSGMQGVGPCQLCVSPETRILTADLQWIRADEVGVGREIIAFDEEGVAADSHPDTLRRHFRTTSVEAMKIEEMERVEVVLKDDRRIICTPNHRFLTWRPERHTWRRADALGVGDLIVAMATWEFDDTRDGGYLAGQLDGEGCWSMGRRGTRSDQAYGSLLWSQSADSPDHDAVREMFEARGFALVTHKAKPRGWDGEDTGRGKPVVAVCIGGSWIEQLRAVGSLRPARMLRHPRMRDVWETRQLNSCDKIEVASVTPLDPGPMVAHQTGTRTLITEGLLSHNTWWAFQDEADRLGGCWLPWINMRVGFAHLAQKIKAHGLAAGLAAYNGSGAGAWLYEKQVMDRVQKWRGLIG